MNKLLLFRHMQHQFLLPQRFLVNNTIKLSVIVSRRDVSGHLFTLLRWHCALQAASLVPVQHLNDITLTKYYCLSVLLNSTKVIYKMRACPFPAIGAGELLDNVVVGWGNTSRCSKQNTPWAIMENVKASWAVWGAGKVAAVNIKKKKKKSVIL